MILFVTGGAGFIGSHVVRMAIKKFGFRVVNIDKLTYAANLNSLADISTHQRYTFERADICDAERIRTLFQTYKPTAILHLAAESHVDRSIDGPEAFIQTNILGTYRLLHASYEYYKTLGEDARRNFRFQHISTDEVFGSLTENGFFTEDTRYDPSSPYSASKAASDHLVRAWGRTYGLPTIITNCSNNYGPFHFPEKFIPLMILNALEGKALPVYGRGDNVRDWIYVEDHVDALLTVLCKGKIGETYNLGSRSELRNIDVVQQICDIVDECSPDPRFASRRALITFVKDRPGHDLRYAIDPTKVETELGWRPSVSFPKGLRQTVRWYLDNKAWCEQVQTGFRDRQGLGL